MNTRNIVRIFIVLALVAGLATFVMPAAASDDCSGSAVLDYLATECLASSDAVVSGTIYAIRLGDTFTVTSDYGTSTFRFMEGWNGGTGYHLEIQDGSEWHVGFNTALEVTHAAMVIPLNMAVNPDPKVNLNHAIFEVGQQPYTKSQILTGLAQITITPGTVVTPEVGKTYGIVTGQQWTMSGYMWQFMIGWNGGAGFHLEVSSDSGATWSSYFDAAQSGVSFRMEIITSAYLPDGNWAVIWEWLPG